MSERRIGLGIVAVVAASFLLAGATVLVWVIDGPDLALGVVVLAVVVHLTISVAFLRRHAHRVVRILRAIQRRVDSLAPVIDQLIARGKRMADELEAERSSSETEADVDDEPSTLDVAARAEATVVARADFLLPEPTKRMMVAGRSESGEAGSQDPSIALRDTVLFDAEWYAVRHPSARPDPVRYYLEVGAQAGHDPHPLFYADWYLLRHPEAAAWPTPLHHFLEVGGPGYYDPHPLFDSSTYASRYLAEGSDEVPVCHYLERPSEDLDPHPLFETAWFRGRYRTVVEGSAPPLCWFLDHGVQRAWDPSPHVSMAELLRRLGTPGGRDPLTALLARWSLGASRPAGPPLGVPRSPREGRSQAQWDYLLNGLWQQPDTFVLYRIIGNDLPPRHRVGQSRQNVRFILENEPELPDCEKRWILNRITDPDEEYRIIELLEGHGQSYIRIPFDLDEYAELGWRFDDFPRPGVTFGDVLDGLPEWAKPIAIDHIYHDKNRYVMNNNGARNTALRDGRSRATWVLPWDGNCFVTAEAWAELRSAVTTNRHLKYAIVPMARVTDNEDLIHPGFRPAAEEEPQVAFRWDAREEFDEDARYGRRPKVRLFYRLGYAGPWDDWKDLEWETVDRHRGIDGWQYFRAGWVARLFSGESVLEGDIKRRGQRRVEAIRSRIDEVDETLARRGFRPEQLFALSEPVLAEQRSELLRGNGGLRDVRKTLLERADQALELAPPSVLDKTDRAPSGDPHDYWHPAPYWWPHPRRKDGRPYVRRDGKRRPGTEPGTPGSERYDRTALQQVLDGGYALALAWYLTDDERYADHGAELVRRWFVDPDTRMNPHLRHAQVRLGHDGDEGQASGIIELSDLYYLLDGARLLERSGSLTTDDVAGLRGWLTNYERWLRTSRQGREERASVNNHGIWYDVQHAAIAAYLDDVAGLLDTLRRADERQRAHFAPDGTQPHELARTMPRHYTAYNLQGWAVLGHLADRVDYGLWGRPARDGCGIERAARWLLPYIERPWTAEQEEGFDEQRLEVLTHHMTRGYPELLAELKLRPTPRGALPAVFSIHDGIRPFWQLGLATSD